MTNSHAVQIPKKDDPLLSILFFSSNGIHFKNWLMFNFNSAKLHLFEREKKMGYHILMFVIVALSHGVLFYSFFMALSSKTDKSQPKKS